MLLAGVGQLGLICLLYCYCRHEGRYSGDRVIIEAGIANVGRYIGGKAVLDGNCGRLRAPL